MALSEVALNQAMGKVLRRFRNDLGMSQKEMGLFLGAGSQTAISNIEKGERPVLASEVWAWAERIEKNHPLNADEIRREFFDSPFVAGWVASDRLESALPQQDLVPSRSAPADSLAA